MELTLVLDAASRLVVAVIVLAVALWSWMSGRLDTSVVASLAFTFVVSFLFEDALFKTEFLLSTLRIQTDNEIDFEP